MSDGHVLLKGRSQRLEKGMPCLGEQAPEAPGLGTLDTNSVATEVEVSDGRVLLEGRSQGLDKGMPCSCERAHDALGLGALLTNFVVAEVEVSDGRVLLEGRSQGLEKRRCRAQANKHRKLRALAPSSPMPLYPRLM